MPQKKKVTKRPRDDDDDTVVTMDTEVTVDPVDPSTEENTTTTTDKKERDQQRKKMKMEVRSGIQKNITERTPEEADAAKADGKGVYAAFHNIDTVMKSIDDFISHYNGISKCSKHIEENIGLLLENITLENVSASFYGKTNGTSKHIDTMISNIDAMCRSVSSIPLKANDSVNTDVKSWQQGEPMKRSLSTKMIAIATKLTKLQEQVTAIEKSAKQIEACCGGKKKYTECIPGTDGLSAQEVQEALEEKRRMKKGMMGSASD